jgi:C-terminal processing protease CtpA/Prc
VPVPGDVWITFTGQEVRHADGRQLQRVGVVPDLRVEPTLEGLREGRDEVLEAAVGFLEGRIP